MTRVPNREGPSPLWTVLAAATVAAAGAFLSYQYYDAKVQANRGVLLERGQTILSALKAGIRSQSYRGRYGIMRLNAILDEVARLPVDLLGVQLRTEQGAIVATGGEEYRPCHRGGEVGGPAG